MRASPLLAVLFPLLGIFGCDGELVKPGTDGVDTATGVGTDTGTPAEDPTPDITVDPGALDLGDVAPGSVVRGTFLIGNVGLGALDAGVAVVSEESGFSVDLSALSLENGESGVITVTFAGAAVGVHSGQISITSNDPDEATVTVYVGATVTEGVIDADGDGFPAADDCVDTDAAINPDSTESWYDGVDQDCDGASDYDQDGDGYAVDIDCDDLDSGIHPDAEEIWYDGVDQDCDSRSDTDQDGDGYESDAHGGDDCDDTLSTASPGSLEDATNGIDDDCDGAVDEALNTEDLDGDGFSEVEGDCNDADIAIHPSAEEVWYDGIDQDCSGGSDYDVDHDGEDSADHGGSDCVDTDASIFAGASEAWYDGVDQNCDGLSDYDADADGYDADAFGGTDCDDSDPGVNPAAIEIYYDGVDGNCDGTNDFDQDGDGYDSALYGGDDCDDLDTTVNPGITVDTWYDGVDQDCDGASDYDQDGDGADAIAYGGDDCDDLDPTIYLGATEVWYDGVDQDCDGASDYDQDGDGATGIAYGGTDCNDLNATIYLGSTEIWYNGVDEDCSGGSDYDQDSDGVTTSAYGGFDCNDLDAGVSPSVAEVCDGVDNDCDGTVDDGVLSTYYADGDADGYGLTVSSTTACAAPAGYALAGGDCDDSLAAVNPGEPEACNGRDDDCDGLVDDGALTTWYRDGDTDGYGVSTISTSSCTAPAGYVASGTDCNDASLSINPAATETCDGVDQDCDGVIDDGTGTATYYADVDGDSYGTSATSATSCSAPAGYVTTGTDCLDSSATVYPGAAETCNGVDDDCDGVIDDGTSGVSTFYADADGDGYGNSAVTSSACTAPAGYVSNATDCDDADATSHPTASEISYDFADNDCDGYADEMLVETESSWTILGGESSDAIGNWGVHATEDLDGDGNPELVVCAGSADYDYYYWFSWYTYADLGLTSFHDVTTRGLGVDLTAGYYEYYGYEADDFNGSAFAVVDDLDGDGYTEVAFGSYQNNANETDDGEVYILDIHGEAGYDFAYSPDADGAIFGDSNNGYLGYSLAAGDFDGDGTQDLASGAPGEQSAKGRVYVTFEGDDFGTDIIDDTESTFYMTGVSSSDHLGYSVAFGDFGNDGYDDLVACSPDDDDGASASGTCWVVNGASTRDSTRVTGTTVSSLDSAVITGSAASDQVGLTPNSLSVGDLDDDGVDDLAVGVPGYDGYTTGGGGIWVYLGGSLSGSETASTANYLIRGDGSLGTGVNMTGDVTGDGVADLLGGATTAGSSKGVVYLFEGGRSTGTYTLPTDQSASWTGKTSGDAFGAAISGLQDLDNDGRNDFAVAATGNDDGATNAGKVYVVPAYP